MNNKPILRHDVIKREICQSFELDMRSLKQKYLNNLSCVILPALEAGHHNLFRGQGTKQEYTNIKNTDQKEK